MPTAKKASHTVPGRGACSRTTPAATQRTKSPPGASRGAAPPAAPLPPAAQRTKSPPGAARAAVAPPPAARTRDRKVSASAAAPKRCTSAGRVRVEVPAPVGPPVLARRTRPVPFQSARCVTATHVRPAVFVDPERLSLATAQRSTPTASPKSTSLCSARSTASSASLYPCTPHSLSLPHPPAALSVLSGAIEREETRARGGIVRDVDKQYAELRAAEEQRRTALVPAAHLALTRGDTLDNGRYHVVGRLGDGGYATVWLCWDSAARGAGSDPTEQFAAVKVCRSSEVYETAAADEIAIMKYVGRHAPAGAPLVRLKGHFKEAGPDGAVHSCLVQPVHGESLHAAAGHGYARWLVVGNTQSSPEALAESAAEYAQHVARAKAAARAVLEGLAALRQLRVVHGDLKPDNVLLAKPSASVLQQMRGYQEELQRDHGVALEGHELVDPDAPLGADAGPAAVLTDFGLSHVLKAGEQRVVKIQTRPYRAPEVVAGVAITPAADVWAAGCVVYEVLTGHGLVDRGGVLATLPSAEQDGYHLDLIHALLGPHRVAEHGTASARYYDAHGRYRNLAVVRGYLGGKAQRDLAGEMAWLTRLPEPDAAAAADFLLFCLGSADSTKRPKAEACLAHPWLSD